MATVNGGSMCLRQTTSPAAPLQGARNKSALTAVFTAPSIFHIPPG